jgi:hypothetical protein
VVLLDERVHSLSLHGCRGDSRGAAQGSHSGRARVATRRAAGWFACGWRSTGRARCWCGSSRPAGGPGSAAWRTMSTRTPREPPALSGWASDCTSRRYSRHGPGGRWALARITAITSPSVRSSGRSGHAPADGGASVRRRRADGGPAHAGAARRRRLREFPVRLAGKRARRVARVRADASRAY